MSFSLDHLNETEFEEFCVDLLSDNGFVNISWRKGTGLGASPADQGRDIECRRIVKDELDRTVDFERWFVECKHYRNGVPPDRLSGALAWATAEAPDKLLIIASNFLSNSAKLSLTRYQDSNRPRFKIKTWERPDLERLCLGNDRITRKYRISESARASAFDINQLSDPLFLNGLAITVSNSLMSRERIPLSGIQPFEGAGLYAIYYEGDARLYEDPEYDSENLKNVPVYLGKAIERQAPVLENRASYYTSQLYRRLKAHLQSIEDARNLDVKDFSFQYSVMADVWAILGEPYLLSAHRPLWNTRISGFGNRDPGPGRRSAIRSDWDTLHAGRKWAELLQPRLR